MNIKSLIFSRTLLVLTFSTPLSAGSDYDYLRVECAWRVKNPTRTARYTAFYGKLASDYEVERRNEVINWGVRDPDPNHAEAVAGVMDEVEKSGVLPLDDMSLGESLFLHGTKPEHLHSILFDGLDLVRRYFRYFPLRHFSCVNIVK
jgi:hypothetical protein